MQVPITHTHTHTKKGKICENLSYQTYEKDLGEK